MNRALIITFFMLLILTSLSFIIYNTTWDETTKSILILCLSATKIFLVAGQFIELRLAHIFWRISFTVIVLLIFSLVIYSFNT